MNEWPTFSRWQVQHGIIPWTAKPQHFKSQLSGIQTAMDQLAEQFKKLTPVFGSLADSLSKFGSQYR